MLFKDLKPNDSVFILNKESVEILPGRIVNIEDNYRQRDYSSYRTNDVFNNKLIDVIIEYGNKSQTFVIPENSQIASAGDLVISPERKSLSSDVEIIRDNARRIIESVDREKSRLDKSSALLSEINPVYKERLEQDKRLNTLENDMGDIKKILMNIQSSLNNKSE